MRSGSSSSSRRRGRRQKGSRTVSFRMLVHVSEVAVGIYNVSDAAFEDFDFCVLWRAGWGWSASLEEEGEGRQITQVGDHSTFFLFDIVVCAFDRVITSGWKRERETGKGGENTVR